MCKKAFAILIIFRNFAENKNSDCYGSGRDQLSEYLDARNLVEGYLVTFSFLKEKTVQEKPEWIEHNGKKIYESVIDCGKE